MPSSAMRLSPSVGSTPWCLSSVRIWTDARVTTARTICASRVDRLVSSKTIRMPAIVPTGKGIGQVSRGM